MCLLCGCLPLRESGGVRSPFLTWGHLQHCTCYGRIFKPGAVSCTAQQGQLIVATKLLVSALCVGGRGRESREGKGAGFGLWVCWKGTGFCHPVLPAPCLSALACTALLRVSSHCFQFPVIQFYFCFQKLLIKLSS